MLELSEVLARAQELNAALQGRTVLEVLPPSSPHKFCWFSMPAEEYGALFSGRTFERAEGFGIFLELSFGESRLCVNDGVCLRFLSPEEKRPAKYQLMMTFDNGSALAFTVAMYGGIFAFNGNFDNDYYRISRERLSALSDGFTFEYFNSLMQSVKPTSSLKAFLATQQRIPGLGNGILQDVLFDARLHPRRKVSSLQPDEKRVLFNAVRSVPARMAQQGGRDTERNIFGNPGGYKTLMCKNALAAGCPVCGHPVVKENYMGGAVYFCPNCQPLT